MINRLGGKKSKGIFISRYTPFLVDSIPAESDANKAGLMKGDKVLTVNKDKAEHFQRFQELLYDNRKKTVNILVERNGEKVELNEVEVPRSGKLGFFTKALHEYKLETRQFSFGESIPKGIANAFGVFTSSLTAIKKVIIGQADFTKTFNSPIAIADAYGTEWVWERFWRLTGMISMALAFMNLLPIPMLDGGYVVFLLYEMIAGKKPSDKFLENTNRVGMVILLTLMVVLLGKDIWFKIADLFI